MLAKVSVSDVHPLNECYSGKVAFITGGGSGIGFTITELLMR